MHADPYQPQNMLPTTITRFTPGGWWGREGWEDIAWGVWWLPRFNFLFFVFFFVVVRKVNPFSLFLHHASLLEKNASLILSYSSQLLGGPFLSKKY
jgi:hypothetical protein